MISFALYGRVSQGVRTASRVLAKAASYSGWQVQCLIPYANNVQAGFVKLSKTPIASREIPESDFFVIFDAKINADLKNAKHGAVIIVNSGDKPRLKTKNKTKIFYVDASDAVEKRMDMVMVGALAKIFGKLPMKYIKSAAEEERMHQPMQAVEKGFKSVRR